MVIEVSVTPAVPAELEALAALAVTNITSASLHLSHAGLRLGEKSKSKSKLRKAKAPKSAGAVASSVTLALVA